jgi:hypothetical protein
MKRSIESPLVSSSPSGTGKKSHKCKRDSEASTSPETRQSDTDEEALQTAVSMLLPVHKPLNVCDPGNFGSIGGVTQYRDLKSLSDELASAAEHLDFMLSNLEKVACLKEAPALLARFEEAASWTFGNRKAYTTHGNLIKLCKNIEHYCETAYAKRMVLASSAAQLMCFFRLLRPALSLVLRTVSAVSIDAVVALSLSRVKGACKLWRASVPREIEECTSAFCKTAMTLASAFVPSTWSDPWPGVVPHSYCAQDKEFLQSFCDLCHQLCSQTSVREMSLKNLYGEKYPDIIVERCSNLRAYFSLQPCVRDPDSASRAPPDCMVVRSVIATCFVANNRFKGRTSAPMWQLLLTSSLWLPALSRSMHMTIEHCFQGVSDELVLEHYEHIYLRWVRDGAVASNVRGGFRDGVWTNTLGDGIWTKALGDFRQQRPVETPLGCGSTLSEFLRLRKLAWKSTEGSSTAANKASTSNEEAPRTQTQQQ